MKFEINYLHAPTADGVPPVSVAVVGHFDSLAHAMLVAEADAAAFDWCQSIEIRDPHGVVRATWELGQAGCALPSN